MEPIWHSTANKDRQSFIRPVVTCERNHGEYHCKCFQMQNYMPHAVIMHITSEIKPFWNKSAHNYDQIMMTKVI